MIIIIIIIQLKNKNIYRLLNSENFQKYDKTTTIFIDSNLSEGIKGEIESERIKNLGFDDLFLATGFSKDQVNKPTWIKEVVGKSPASLLLQ